MKKIILLAACVLSLLATVPAQAQINFGVKAGVNMSNLSYDDIEYAAGSVTGFTGGVMLEAMVPIIGIGAEASVMYSRKGGEVPTGSETTTTFQTDNIDIPINLKWKVGIPYLGKLFLIAGPSFKFKIDDNLGDNITNQKNFDLSINAGGGVELFSKIQIAAQYGWGLGEDEVEVDLLSSDPITFNNRYWTLTAAYLF